MRGIADTIARLAAAGARANLGKGYGSTRLSSLQAFGTNPGALLAHVYVPTSLPKNAPLVVVLHGCAQSAAVYDRASGWSELADEQSFVLLYPEQQRANNANGCFNWFEVGDTRRDSGEALSIRQMIAAVQERHAIDPDRIFVTGLSAGGAMAASMLATYPEVFAGGAIIAGLPHGVASGMVQAFDRMRAHGLPSGTGLQAALRDASSHKGPWPVVSVWHGSADSTVGVGNAEAVLAQWRGVHGLPEQPTCIERIDGATHRSWRGRDGRVLLEATIIPGMGHGTPIKTKGDDAYGVAAPYMLDVGISSTARIARSWGLIHGMAQPRNETHDAVSEHEGLPALIPPRRLHGRRIEPEPTRASAGLAKVIEDALHAAGMMR